MPCISTPPKQRSSLQEYSGSLVQMQDELACELNNSVASCFHVTVTKSIGRHFTFESLPFPISLLVPD